MADRARADSRTRGTLRVSLSHLGSPLLPASGRLEARPARPGAECYDARVGGPGSSGRGHVLITGASTGIGRACALYLAKRGFTVIAGTRRESDGQSLVSDSSGAVRSVLIDVTSAGSIAAAARAVREITGSSGLLGLMNNAGINVIGPVEFVTIDEWRRQFEVNLFGHIAVTQAMLPLLRDHVKNMNRSARIIMVGSIGGFLAPPILAPYAASKHALEAVCDALRLELKDQNIQTSLLEPGTIQSEGWRKGDESLREFPEGSAARQRYGKLIDAMITVGRRGASTAIPAEHVARVVESCLIRPRAPARVLVGLDAKILALLCGWLPDRWLDALVGKALTVLR
jgi:NAD(P)-dependent dehydrogenase (short-subunit alcohol dehydrogenase family)